MTVLEDLNEKRGFALASSGDSHFSVKSHSTETGGEIKGIRVFRAGEFADSLGYRASWESYHLQQMISNFKHLKESGIFPNVPVRADHSMSVKDVVGYISDLYIDPEDPNFLAADFTITEPEAMARWDRGTYRARSLEVGVYSTNDESSYWPVVFGVAFVDLPAVEGLYSSGLNRKANRYQQIITDKESNPMGTDNSTETDSKDSATEGTDGAGAGTPPATESFSKGAPPAAPPAAQAQTFRVNGQTVSDFAAVQTHIDTLEKFRTDSISKTRQDAVARWAKEGKITQPQVATLGAVVETMTEAQYEAFASSYEAAPESALLGKHTGDTQTGDQNKDESGAADAEFNLMVETVRNHARANMSAESIRKTPTYRRLEAACKSRNESVEKYVELI